MLNVKQKASVTNIHNIKWNGLIDTGDIFNIGE